MSDDRMDRAERIRNMREGNRGTDEETADTEQSADTADSGESDPSSDDSASTTESAGNDPSTVESEATEPSDATSTAESEATESPPATSDGAGTADDASAVAQRAAASAAEVMGESEESPDSDGTGGEDTGTAGGGTGAAGGGLMGQGPTGVELPDQQLLEEAMANSTVQSTEGGARAAAIEGEATQSEELVRVLEFALGDEYYCLDIEYVEEIVKRDAVTRVPNTPEFVDGVVDLRGQITTILEPKAMMDIDAEGEQGLIIVFDPDQFEEQGAVGWVVDEVRQVVPVTEDEVNSSPVDADYINGVVDREEYDQFVIWVEPDDALAKATSTEE